MFTNENKLLRQLPGKSIEALKGTEKTSKKLRIYSNNNKS